MNTRTWYIIEHAGTRPGDYSGMNVEEIEKAIQGFYDENQGGEGDPTTEEIHSAAEEIAEYNG